MELQLTRTFTDGTLTLGTLGAVGSTLALVTLELPWRPLPGALCGRPDVSCVPAGAYQLVTHDSPRHPRTWALVAPTLGVFHEPGDMPPGFGPARIACLIHTANWVTQLEGCIGIGRDKVHSGNGNGDWYITESQLAMQDLRAAVPWTNGHTLTIQYASGVDPDD